MLEENTQVEVTIDPDARYRLCSILVKSGSTLESVMAVACSRHFKRNRSLPPRRSYRRDYQD